MIDEGQQIGGGRFFSEERRSISSYFRGVGARDVRAELILQRVRRLQCWLIEPGDRGSCLKFICEDCLRNVLGKSSTARKRRFDFTVEVISAEIAEWLLDESIATADERQRALAHFRNWAKQVVTWNSSWYKPQKALANGVFEHLRKVSQEQMTAQSRDDVPPAFVVSQCRGGSVIQKTFF